MTAQAGRGLIRTSYGHIHYREAGSGPAIVLLHINQQSSAVMTELLEALAPRRRAIAIDYPGHGMSDHLALQPTIPDYAHCVLEVLDALGVGAFTALGEATGAAVSATLGRVQCPVLLLTGEQFYFRHRVPEIEQRVRRLESEVLAGVRFCATWEKAAEIARRVLQE